MKDTEMDNETATNLTCPINPRNVSSINVPEHTCFWCTEKIEIRSTRDCEDITYSMIKI